MTLFLFAGEDEFAVNKAAIENGVMAIEKCDDGVWNAVGSAAYNVSDNEMVVAVPKAVLRDTTEIAFRWADNFNDDPQSFYTKGSTLPYGRMNLVYKAK